MNFSIQRQSLLEALQKVIGVVERRQTMPILNNILLTVHEETLSLTATDLEVELVAEEIKIAEGSSPGNITVSGRKLYDICRALPDSADISVTLSGEKITLRAGRSRFTLSTLKAADFPVVDEITTQQTLKLKNKELKTLLQKTHFAMAQQDVRYYLNGLLLETNGQTFRAVATDGHRLALCEIKLDEAVERNEQVILPRKGVMELERLLDGKGDLELILGSNHAQVKLQGTQLTSKLIDGRFPEYDRVLPKDCQHVITADRQLLRAALQRAAILSNEKYRGVRLDVTENQIIVEANNPEEEEAEESLEVIYKGEKMEIGFNVNYLLDALGAVEEKQVEVGLSDANSSCLIHGLGKENPRFVVMPMRL